MENAVALLSSLTEQFNSWFCLALNFTLFSGCYTICWLFLSPLFFFVLFLFLCELSKFILNAVILTGFLYLGYFHLCFVSWKFGGGLCLFSSSSFTSALCSSLYIWTKTHLSTLTGGPQHYRIGTGIVMMMITKIEIMMLQLWPIIWARPFAMEYIAMMIWMRCSSRKLFLVNVFASC